MVINIIGIFIFDDSIKQVFWVSLKNPHSMHLFLIKNSKVSGNLISFSSILVNHSITIKQRSLTQKQIEPLVSHLNKPYFSFIEKLIHNKNMKIKFFLPITFHNTNTHNLKLPL